MPRAALLALVLGCASTIALPAAGAGRPGTVVVPADAAHTDILAGYDELRAAGLRIVLTRAVPISSLIVPLVSQLTPRPGSRVRVGSVVRITPGFGPIGSPVVSKADPHYRVPSFVGKSALAAADWASSHGLYWAVPHLPALTRSSAAHLLGAYRIITQQPKPGGTIRQGVLIKRKGYHPTPLTLTVVAAR